MLRTLLMATTLSAQSPEVGVPPGFKARAEAYLSTDPLELWRKEIRQPILTAWVEIIGEATREEKQMAAAEDFRVRLLREIRDLVKDTEPRGGVSRSSLLTVGRLSY